VSDKPSAGTVGTACGRAVRPYCYRVLVADVNFATVHGDLPAYVATPAGAGPWPGVVVIHDVLGLSRDPEERKRFGWYMRDTRPLRPVANRTLELRDLLAGSSVHRFRAAVIIGLVVEERFDGLRVRRRGRVTDPRRQPGNTLRPGVKRRFERPR
jgi:hypothetical protein